MTDTALNSYGKPLSMTPAAIRKRDYRARRDKQGANLSQAGPSSATRDKSLLPRQGRVIPFNGCPTSPETYKHNQPLNGRDTSPVQGLMSHSPAPSIAPDEVRSRALPPDVSETVSRPKHRWLAVAFRVLGILGALAGLGSNGTFLMGQAQDTRAMVVMFAATLFYDGMVLALPSAGFLFWRERARLDSLMCVVIYCLCMVFAGLAAAGFAYQNMGDAAASRGTEAGVRASLDREIKAAEADRARLTVIPVSPEQIAAATEARDGVCDPDVRRTYNAEKCQQRREALATLTGRDANNKRAEALDRNIRELNEKLLHAPKASSANPQAEGVAMIIASVGLITGFNLTSNPHIALGLHYFAFVFLPVGAGFCFAWDLMIRMLGARRSNEKRAPA